MTKIDLITGFLGSGKTTFIKLYARYLISQGENIGILENDYGAVNVDMMLLEDLQGDQCELEMVSASCHMDCHKRRFKTKLISMGMCGYDRVIVEPSGIFDIDEFFDICNEDPINRMYQIENVITIVDAKITSDFSESSNFYLASQIANSKAIILSKTQLIPASTLPSVIEHLNQAAKLVKLNKNISDVIYTDNWDNYSHETFEQIRNCGHEICSYEKIIVGQELSYSSVYFLELSKPLNFIKEKVRQLFDNPKCGNIFRIKGFVYDNSEWYQINATRNDFDVNKIKNGQDVIIVIGEHLDRKLIESIMEHEAT